MLEAYQQDRGLPLEVLSSYRSVKSQIDLVNKFRKAGKSWEEIYESIAPPGYSDHQTGLAVDLCSAGSENVTCKPAFDWLAAHAHEYGFELRYPYCDASRNEGQFKQEPWHYLWKGIGLARKVELEDCESD